MSTKQKTTLVAIWLISMFIVLSALLLTAMFAMSFAAVGLDGYWNEDAGLTLVGLVGAIACGYSSRWAARFLIRVINDWPDMLFDVQVEQ